MITFIVSILLLIVVAPTALVFGLKLAWFVIKKMFKGAVKRIDDWTNPNV